MGRLGDFLCPSVAPLNGAKRVLFGKTTFWFRLEKSTTEVLARKSPKRLENKPVFCF